MSVTPLSVPRVPIASVHAQALNAVRGKTGPEILGMLGELDSAAARFNLQRTDETFRLFRETASIWRTELSRVMPGCYVSLALLK